MKNITNILLSVVVVGFVGCGSTGSTDTIDDENNHNQDEQIVPSPSTGVGPELELKNYLYYDNGLENYSRIFVDTYGYSVNSEGTVGYQGVTQSEFTKGKDPQNNSVIAERVNAIFKSEDVIYPNKIISYKYNAEGGISLTVNYPKLIQENEQLSSIVSNGVEVRCVVRDFEGGYTNLSSKLPYQIYSDLSTRVNSLNLNYLDVMHVYCGGTDSSSADIYYASGYGKVLGIVKSSDLVSATYDIVSKNGIYQ